MQYDSMISLRLSESRRRRYTLAAGLLGVNRSRLIETAVDTYIQQHAPQVERLVDSQREGKRQ